MRRLCSMKCSKGSKKIFQMGAFIGGTAVLWWKYFYDPLFPRHQFESFFPEVNTGKQMCDMVFRLTSHCIVSYQPRCCYWQLTYTPLIKQFNHQKQLLSQRARQWPQWLPRFQGDLWSGILQSGSGKAAMLRCRSGNVAIWIWECFLQNKEHKAGCWWSAQPNLS